MMVTTRFMVPGYCERTALVSYRAHMQLAHELVGRHDAAPLVLIHGITECHQSWGALVPRLAEDHLVLAVDLRGHGQSDVDEPYDPMSYAADVVETASALGLRGPLVIGHSLGGIVATAFAAQAPCLGVINVDQPLQLSAFKEGLMQLEPMLTGDPESFEAAIGMVFDGMRGALPQHEVDRIAALRRADQPVVLGTWDSVLHSSLDELDATVDALAGAVTVPYLSLHGIDPGPGYAEWLAHRIPSSTVEIWADMGHYPHLVDPDRFLRRVAEFEATLGS
jgi:pimeloyl-ACP methyl ester carboxylesterase